MPDAGTIVGLLADDDRRRVFAALVLGGSTLAEVRASTGLTSRRAASALGRLVAGRRRLPLASFLCRTLSR